MHSLTSFGSNVNTLNQSFQQKQKIHELIRLRQQQPPPATPNYVAAATRIIIVIHLS